MPESKFPSYQEMYERLQHERLAHQASNATNEEIRTALINNLNDYRGRCEAIAAERDTVQAAGARVVRVYNDPDTMLAYLRGDPSELHEVIMGLKEALRLQ